MPVVDHGVHELTRRDAGARYGCHSLPRSREPLLVKDGYAVADLHGCETVHAWREIKDFGSLECRYDASLTDPQCAGCPHAGTGEAYAAEVARLAS